MSMSKREFRRAFLVARRAMARTSVDNLHETKRFYEMAARNAGRILQRHLDANAASLTTEHWERIKALLMDEAQGLGNRIDAMNRRGVARITRMFVRNTTQQMRQSGLVGVRGINARSIDGIGAAINKTVIHNMVSRMVGGMNYSARIWRLGTDWLNDVRGVTAAGIGSGRDPRKIARDLLAYTRDGKIRVAKAWGPNMSLDAKDRAMRLPKNIDYRALRLVRSEMYMSQQVAQGLAGRANPGCNGLFNWVTNPNRLDWDCPCEEYEQGSPYKYEDIPSYPHSNCMCSVEPLLRDHDEFVSDLIRWDKGESVDYLDEWHRNFYLPNAA